MRDREAAKKKIRFVPRAEREQMALAEKRKEQEENERRRKSVVRFEDSPYTASSQTAPLLDKAAGKRARETSDFAIDRERYMGPDLSKSKFSANKRNKRSKDKFSFEWDEAEDTTSFDSIYQRPQPGLFERKPGGFVQEARDPEAVRQFVDDLIKRDPETGQARAEQILANERWRTENPRAQLDKHWSKKRLEYMRERDWRIFKEDYSIATRGGAIPNPLRDWNEAGLPDQLMRIVDQVGYIEPTPIQRAAIPIALQSRDLIGVAVTGSGKTGAFLIPLLVHISRLAPLSAENRDDGPYAIILAPTRELAQQIDAEARKFATPLGFSTAVIVGGHSIEEQSFRMQAGAEIVIATPGRLVDCIERRLIVLSQCTYVIMDEADRMIDMGFEEPVNKILDALPVTNEKPDSELAEDPDAMRRGFYRQTMMYTATMPTAVERIARKYLRRPAIVTIGNVGEAVETVEQRVEHIQGEDRRKRRLQEILASGEFQRPIIVFVNVKSNCDTIARDIKHMGFSAVTLHGSKTQAQREAALASLKEGRTDVLVATDLAGRGIDITDVSLVVNFNMPGSIESYTHRIGRTGRAGKSGVAITFWGNEDADVLYDLKQMLMKSQLSKVPDDLRKHEAAQQKGRKRGEVMGKAIT